jgi:hypothetical protein
VFTICENADRIEESAKCLDNIKYQQSQTGSACLSSKTTTVLSEWTVPKSMDVFYIFIALDICSIEMYYTLHIEYVLFLQVRMSTTGIIIHYIVWGCQSHNSQEIQFEMGILY